MSPTTCFLLSQVLDWIWSFHLISHCGTESQRCFFIFFLTDHSVAPLCLSCNKLADSVSASAVSCVSEISCWYRQPRGKSKNATNSTYNCECRFAENTSAAVVIVVTMDSATAVNTKQVSAPILTATWADELLWQKIPINEKKKLPIDSDMSFTYTGADV